MDATWKIIDHHLALECNGNLLHPSAEKIYAVLSEDGTAHIDGVSCLSPIKELPDIRFSKVGSPVEVLLENDEAGKIYLRIIAKRRGNSVPVDIVKGNVIDHCVIDGTWFFLQGKIGDIQEIVSSVGILSDGEISIRQYVKLLELDALRQCHAITNHVNAELLHTANAAPEGVPSTLKANLYKYQEVGYGWIQYMLENSQGCILGDEMGLGKTMQVITEMLYLKSVNRAPMMVVAPISLLANWAREISKFAPSLSTYVHHGTRRTGFYKDLLQYDVVIIPYTAVVADLQMLNMIKWELVVLDEAQNIKSPYSARTKACKKLNRVRSIAVTGTPFENHITDIWSLLDYAQPSLLGSLQQYSDYFTDDLAGGELIEPILSPLMIRRLVADVAKDLPEKIVSTQPLEMSEEESAQYTEFVQELQENFDATTINIGMLQKLRVYCTHPLAVQELPLHTDPANHSVKYQRLCEIVEEIVSRREKVLVFTSFKKMFDILGEDIPKRFGIEIWSINGETPVEDRQKIVDRFNQYPHPAMLVLNPKAAGAGLNITGANHVIHYNLEWNPSLEDQASARAYRRGQEKTVFVYRLYYVDTVEQVVNERIERKRDISTLAIVGNDGLSQDRADILRAIQLLPNVKS